MKIITRAVYSLATGTLLEEDSYEYSGPVARCKSSGSSPQPVDPYQQASAQYGLDTGVANYNAALNRTNSSNPLGSNTWSVTGLSGGGAPTSIPNSAYFGFGGNGSSISPTDESYASSENGSGAPIYSQSTSLSPQFNQALQAPINSYNTVGDAGVGQAAQQAAQAAYGQEVGYLQPQEQQQTETLNSQLANEGATPGSAAYNYETQNLGRQQTFSNQQAANAAIGAGEGELTNLTNIGSTELQNELASRMAPISEYEALQGNSSSPISAATPDISNAFNQQYQAALAGYNANTATNNANTGAGAGLLGTLAYALLS